MAGSIATEPSIAFHGDKKFLVNATTRSGMSGAPVIWVYQNKHIRFRSGQRLVNSVFGDFVQFAGVYSGRIDDSSCKKDSSEIVSLACVWKPELIDEIISNSSGS